MSFAARNAVHYEDEDDPENWRADVGIALSADGMRAVSNLSNLRAKKKQCLDPGDLDDDFTQWTPVIDLEDDEANAVADTVSSFDIAGDNSNPDTEKRKRYLNTDQPMTSWIRLKQWFLEALLRRNGLGDYVSKLACTCCGDARASTRFFRCGQCGDFLQCAGCVRSRHQLTPLHTLQEWKEGCWMEARLCGSEPDANGVTGVGLVYQLGHHGLPCDFPKPAHSMVVIDITGIHTVDVSYCGCDKGRRESNIEQLMGNVWYPATVVDPGTCSTFQALEHFRILNVVGNVTVHDYVGALERLTDPLRVSKVPDRYKAFGRMSRQYAFLLRGKRAGRGHEPDGLNKTEPGGLAVPCWACPHDGKNLPNGWKDVDPQFRFLYMLLLALDANFRLKNRLRANERDDPALGNGLGYFVETEAYKEHLRKYVAEKDISTCIAFAALLQKETRLTSGLRSSGVGGCVCARHGVVRPLGLGDLQKGERYANMDYIFLSAIIGVAILFIAISYDIACQWKVHLLERAKKIRDTTSIEVDLDEFEIQFALPVWHAQAHEMDCQTQNSLSYTVGVGRTDGEGIERTWAVLNPIGFATKEMGEGARHDAMENKVDHLNFEKNLGEGDTLARKLIVAIAERDKQVADFAAVDSTLSSGLRRKWQAQVDAWLADKTQPNPYNIKGGKKAGPSEAAIFADLKAAEEKDVAKGRAPIGDTKSTASAFIKAGLQIEESQRRIKAEVRGVTLVTADHSSQIQEMRLSLLKKIRTYERLQQVFMPGVDALREAEEEARDMELPPPKAEDVKLWLPSALMAVQRRTACRRGVIEVEAKLRQGQCADALDNLRSRLHAQRHLITWRNANSVGQRQATRSATLIGRVSDRIARVASKYHAAWAALIALKGLSHAPQFKELNAGDMNVNAEEESDSAARVKLARLGSSKRSRNEPSGAAKKKTISWIWTVGGGPGEDDAALHESVQVEWAKAKARRDRWVEEVAKLREEMKMVLRMLRYIQAVWLRRAERGRDDVDEALAAGLRAYATRQVVVHRRIAMAFRDGWSRSMATAVRDVIRQDGTLYSEILDGHGMDDAQDVGLVEVEMAVAAST